MTNEQTQNSTNTLLDQALFYLEQLGWNIIPVGQNKRPLFEWKKYQTQKVTREELIAWWKQYPEANIGIVTGNISNLVVVDIDPRHGGSDEPFKFVKTYKVKTGGGGWHYYFKYDEGIKNVVGIRPGIDIRGEGGYVIAPPSIHPSGNKYEWEVGPYG